MTAHGTDDGRLTLTCRGTPAELARLLVQHWNDDARGGPVQITAEHSETELRPVNEYDGIGWLIDSNATNQTDLFAIQHTDPNAPDENRLRTLLHDQAETLLAKLLLYDQKNANIELTY